MKVKTILLAGCLTLLCACSESKYDLDNLVPNQYHKILYVNNSGKQNVTLYDTNEDNVYTLSVIKSGSNPNQVAGADICVLTQEELDHKYSKPEGVNYKIINNNSYSLETNHLDFSGSDRYKIVSIALNPQKVKNSMNNDPTAVWVLPLQVTSATDSINSDKDELFLQIKAVIMPAIGFANTSVNLKEYNYGSVSTISENIAMGLDTENKWDLECQFTVDKEYIETYNKANGTMFRPFPQDTYSVPESMAFPKGTTNAPLAVSIKGEQLEPGDYMLPVRIKSISQFEISSTHAIYPLAIRILGSKLDRTSWTAEANTEEPNGEGPGNGIAKCVLDGNLGTYWHSQWNGGSHNLPHELIIDAKAEYTFTQFAMSQRQNESYTDTGDGEFYVSSDKNTWTKVGKFSMKKILSMQIFSITPAKGRYFKIVITRSNRDLNCSLSEVYAYGLK